MLFRSGGFEFFNSGYSKILKELYKEEPYTQFNYSWPGQLQKLVEKNNIKVFNHAKAGYGNERMYRITYDIVMNNQTDDKLFIYEFSSVGRKEYWSNSFNTHFIVNYGFEYDNKSNKEQPILKGLAGTYGIDEYEYTMKLKSIIQPFISETMNFDIQDNLWKMNNEFFIDFLIGKNINFLIVSNPYYSNPSLINNKQILFPDGFEFLSHVDKNSLTIINETNGKITDYHPSLQAHKELALIIKNKI